MGVGCNARMRVCACASAATQPDRRPVAATHARHHHQATHPRKAPTQAQALSEAPGTGSAVSTPPRHLSRYLRSRDSLHSSMLATSASTAPCASGGGSSAARGRGSSSAARAAAVCSGRDSAAAAGAPGVQVEPAAACCAPLALHSVCRGPACTHVATHAPAWGHPPQPRSRHHRA